MYTYKAEVFNHGKNIGSIILESCQEEEAHVEANEKLAFEIESGFEIRITEIE